MLIQIAFWICVFAVFLMLMALGRDIEKKNSVAAASDFLSASIYIFIAYVLWTVWP